MLKKLLICGLVTGLALSFSITAFAHGHRGGHGGGHSSKHYYGDGHSYCGNYHYQNDGCTWHN